MWHSADSKVQEKCNALELKKIYIYKDDIELKKLNWNWNYWHIHMFTLTSSECRMASSWMTIFLAAWPRSWRREVEQEIGQPKKTLILILGTSSVWKIGQNLLSRQHQRSIQKSNYAVQQARGPSFSHPTACWDDYETNRDYVSNNTFITLTLAYFCLRQWSSCWNKPFVYMWAVSRQLSKPVSSRLNV